MPIVTLAIIIALVVMFPAAVGLIALIAILSLGSFYYRREITRFIRACKSRIFAPVYKKPASRALSAKR